MELEITWINERDEELGYVAECQDEDGTMLRVTEKMGISFGMTTDVYHEVIANSVEVDGTELGFMTIDESELRIYYILFDIVSALKEGKDSEDIQEILDECDFESGKEKEKEEKVEG